MRILFLGDIVGKSGCEAITNNLPVSKYDKKMDYIVTEKYIL